MGTAAHLGPQALVLVWHDRLADTAERRVEVGHDLLAPDDEDHAPGTHRIRADLAAGVRGRDQGAVSGHGLDAAEHHVRRRADLPDLAALGLAIHRHLARPDRVEAGCVQEDLCQPEVVECLRLRPVDLRPLRDKTEDALSRLRPCVNHDRLDVIVAEGGGDRLDVFLGCGLGGLRRIGQDRFGGHVHVDPCRTGSCVRNDTPARKLPRGQPFT